MAWSKCRKLNLEVSYLSFPSFSRWYNHSTRGTTVMDYRAYILDVDGRIIGVHELDCANDDEPSEIKLLDGHDLEVWHRERRVARLKHHTRQ